MNTGLKLRLVEAVCVKFVKVGQILLGSELCWSDWIGSVRVRSGWVNAGQIRLNQFGAGLLGSVAVRSGWISSDQVWLDQFGSGQVKSI